MQRAFLWWMTRPPSIVFLTPAFEANDYTVLKAAQRSTRPSQNRIGRALHRHSRPRSSPILDGRNVSPGFANGSDVPIT